MSQNKPEGQSLQLLLKKEFSKSSNKKLREEAVNAEVLSRLKSNEIHLPSSDAEMFRSWQPETL